MRAITTTAPRATAARFNEGSCHQGRPSAGVFLLTLPEALQALHTLCDASLPLVHQAHQNY
jgi:hypothetical protein